MKGQSGHWVDVVANDLGDIFKLLLSLFCPMQAAMVSESRGCESGVGYIQA
jgi:hypothetical protein